MAQPNSSGAIVSAPNVPAQPYDAANSSDVGQWRKLPGGPVDPGSWRLTGRDFEDSPPWKQV
jgi:hypothetical protein